MSVGGTQDAKALLSISGADLVSGVYKAIEDQVGRRLSQIKRKQDETSKAGVDAVDRLRQGWSQMLTGLNAGMAVIGRVGAQLAKLGEHAMEGAKSLDIGAVFRERFDDASGALDRFRAASHGTIDDTTLQSMANKMAGLGLTTNEAAGVISASMQIAASRGLEAQQVVEQVSQAVATGRVTSLAALGVTIELSGAQSKQTQILEQLNAQFRDDAPLTHTERLKQHVTAYNNLKSSAQEWWSAQVEYGADAAMKVKNYMDAEAASMANLTRQTILQTWSIMQMAGQQSDAAKLFAEFERVQREATIATEKYNTSKTNYLRLSLAEVDTMLGKPGKKDGGKGMGKGGGKGKGGQGDPFPGLSDDPDLDLQVLAQAATIQAARNELAEAGAWARRAIAEQEADDQQRLMDERLEAIAANIEHEQRLMDERLEAIAASLEHEQQIARDAAESWGAVLQESAGFSSVQAAAIGDAMQAMMTASNEETATVGIRGVNAFITGTGSALHKWAGWRILEQIGEVFAWAWVNPVRAVSHGIAAAKFIALAAATGGGGGGGGGAAAAGGGGAAAAPRNYGTRPTERPRQEAAAPITVYMMNNTIVGGRSATEAELGWRLGEYLRAGRMRFGEVPA